MSVVPDGIQGLLLNVLGVLGFAIYVLNYCLISFNRLNPGCIAYFALNLMASSLVLISLIGAFNLASALIQSFWILISTAAIVLRVRAGHRLI